MLLTSSRLVSIPILDPPSVLNDRFRVWLDANAFACETIGDFTTCEPPLPRNGDMLTLRGEAGANGGEVESGAEISAGAFFGNFEPEAEAEAEEEVGEEISALSDAVRDGEEGTAFETSGLLVECTDGEELLRL